MGASLGTGHGGWIEVDLRQPVRVEFNLGKVFGAGHHLSQAGVEISQKASDIEAQVEGRVGIQVAVHAGVELSGSADVAIAEMVKCDGSLDQRLIEPAGRTAILRPEFLPDIVALVILAGVEVGDSC